MGKEILDSAPKKGRSGRTIWIIVIVVVLCLALLCCAVVVGGVLWLRPAQIKTFIPGVQVAPTAAAPLPAVPVLPATSLAPAAPAATSQPPASPVPALPAPVDIASVLDAAADPIWGMDSLQRGFSPDPYTLFFGSNGLVDTSASSLPCGFTSSAPTYAFNLSGGASETFLRLYFVPDADMDATLIVLTPNQQWLCGENMSMSTFATPMIDIEFAPSGRYAVWVGVGQAGADTVGMLSITQSADNAPK